MKIVNSLVVFVLAFFMLSSCQKELNFEDIAGTAAGGLGYDDATHDCYPSTVNGQYIVDTVLNTNNFIDVQVNLTSTGAYTIQSDTTNGYSFTGTGNLGTPGLNTVRLYGSGTPLAAQTDQFIIRFDTSICIIDVTVLATVVNAEYTFAGAGGTCTGAVLSGLYMQGIPMGSGNTVAVSVDVTAIGNYNITTTTLGGITFSGTGTFTATGPQTVTLTANGIPTTASTYTFPLAGASPGCAFAVTVVPLAAPATFVFGGAPLDCTGTVFTGTYQTGTPMSSSNTVTVDVTVTVAGSYSITTNVNNGVSFSGSGVFTTTGPQQVTLSATGLPTAVGAFDYDLLGGSTTCVINVLYN